MYKVFHDVYVFLFMMFRLLHKAWYGIEPVHKIEYHKVPWLWIGAVYPDMTLDVTQTVDKTIGAGTRVDKEYLMFVTGENTNTWKYLDMETLEEKEFPSEGFVIGENEITHIKPPIETDSS